MTRQCAWCACYLDSVESETIVTHGICECCAEKIRRSMPEDVAPLLGDVLLTARAQTPRPDPEPYRLAMEQASYEVQDQAA